jgi:hypothetical protein
VITAFNLLHLEYAQNWEYSLNLDYFRSNSDDANIKINIGLAESWVLDKWNCESEAQKLIAYVRSLVINELVKPDELVETKVKTIRFKNYANSC